MNQSPFLSHNPLKGILFVNVALLIYALTDALFKAEVAHHPVGIILFVRAIVVAGIIGVYIAATGRHDLFRTQRLRLLALRGVFSVLSTWLFVYSLKQLDIAEATTISMLSPIIIALIAFKIFDEKIGFIRWLVILGGFAAVAFIMQPGGNLWNKSGLFALLSAFFYAISMILNKKLVATEDTLTILFYLSVFSTVIIFPFAVLDYRSLTLSEVPIYGGIGILSIAASYFAISAYRYTSAHTIGAFDYMEILYVAIAGFLFLGEVPGYTLFTGAIGLIFCGLYFIYDEFKKASDPANLSP